MAEAQQPQPTASTEDDWPPRTPYYHFLGLEVVERVDGQALVRLPHRPELCNSRGEIHGGAQESLLDVALSQAIRSVLPSGSSVATITLTCSHLAAGHGSLTGHGRVIQAGRSVATAEGHVEDADGRRVACALGTYRVWRTPAAEPGPRSRPS
jgi:uncharacterized protein (TIGR00369 family)